MPVAYTDRRRQDRYGNLLADFYQQVNRPVQPGPARWVPGVVFLSLLMCGLGVMTQGWQNLLFVRLVEEEVGHETCYDTWGLAIDYIIPVRSITEARVAAELGRPFYYFGLGCATLVDTLARWTMMAMTLRLEPTCDTNCALRFLDKPAPGPILFVPNCGKSDPPTLFHVMTYPVEIFYDLVDRVISYYL